MSAQPMQLIAANAKAYGAAEADASTAQREMRCGKRPYNDIVPQQLIFIDSNGRKQIEPNQLSYFSRFIHDDPFDTSPST